jgi:hypothetical protein
MDISPSTETVNFRWDRKELISLIKLVEKFNLSKFYLAEVPCCIKGFFCIQEHRRRRHVIVEI